MDHRLYARALAEALAFFEFAPEWMVHPDYADEISDRMAHHLQGLDDLEQRRLCEAFESVAGEFRDEEVTAFVSHLGEALGLDHEST